MTNKLLNRVHTNADENYRRHSHNHRDMNIADHVYDYANDDVNDDKLYQQDERHAGEY